MAIPDFYTFLLNNVNASAARKIELKNAFSKQIGWTEKIDDGDGGEIDNPVSFQEALNSGTWEYVRGTCQSGQGQLDKEEAAATDDFKDLVG